MLALQPKRSKLLLYECGNANWSYIKCCIVINFNTFEHINLLFQLGRYVAILLQVVVALQSRGFHSNSLVMCCIASQRGFQQSVTYKNEYDNSYRRIEKFS